jgi:hypothetical protein
MGATSARAIIRRSSSMSRDLERPALRPGNVYGADGCDGVLEPVVAR